MGGQYDGKMSWSFLSYLVANLHINGSFSTNNFLISDQHLLLFEASKRLLLEMSPKYFSLTQDASGFDDGKSEDADRGP